MLTESLDRVVTFIMNRVAFTPLVRVWAVILSLAGCGDDGAGAHDTSSSAGGSTSNQGAAGAGGANATGGMGGAGTIGGADQGGAGGAEGTLADYTVTQSLITTNHRYIPNQMFGGWGPHLGHMVWASDDDDRQLYFVDDLCSQMSGGQPALCDVNVDHTLGYFRREGTKEEPTWALIGAATVPGTVQQNTATIASADGATLYSYGIAVAAARIVECSFALPAGPAACNYLPFVLPAFSNYVGAAISPDGYRIVWWTVVADGGGGTFHYIVDYGGGWNGPRSGGAAGYNDSSYINIAFPTDDPPRFVMHTQLVSGLAPNWSFFGGIGWASLDTADAVDWSLPLAAIDGDAVVSTNDIWIDPVSQDEHVLARTNEGRAAYYHRPPGGTWSPATFFVDSTLRARFVPHCAGGGTTRGDCDRLALVAGTAGTGLTVRLARASDRTPGQPIDWSSLSERVIELPTGYESIYAIYPGAVPYQVVPGSSIDVAIVGSERQNEVLNVTLSPP